MSRLDDVRDAAKASLDKGALERVNLERATKSGKARIRRLMMQEGICPKQKRRFPPRTTQSDPYSPCAPNVIAAMPPASFPAERFKEIATTML